MDFRPLHYKSNDGRVEGLKRVQQVASALTGEWQQASTISRKSGLGMNATLAALQYLIISKSIETKSVRHTNPKRYDLVNWYRLPLRY